MKIFMSLPKIKLKICIMVSVEYVRDEEGNKETSVLCRRQKGLKGRLWGKMKG